jgi:hypothetical protein
MIFMRRAFLHCAVGPASQYQAADDPSRDDTSRLRNFCGQSRFFTPGSVEIAGFFDREKAFMDRELMFAGRPRLRPGRPVKKAAD